MYGPTSTVTGVSERCSQKNPGGAAGAGGAARARAPKLQKVLMRSVHSNNVTAYREAIRSDGELTACFLSQRGFLGTAWLGAPGSGGTALPGEVFRLKALDYLGLPWEEAAGLPCPQCSQPLSAAGVFRHAECCGTATRRHSSAGTEDSSLLGTL